MQITTTNPITNCVFVDRSSEGIKKDHDDLFYELGNILNKITECRVELENPVFVTGETMSELSTTPEAIVWTLHGANIRLPDSIIETLKEWKDKIVPYTLLQKPLNNEERDQLAMHVVNLRRFLFDEVVNPALKNTYPL
ncbi:MAG: hypothetical protein J6S85_06685 [Methanobrevibacter sp.]|nr:hypothetical protein [Methanobrevibacter sp.]